MHKVITYGKYLVKAENGAIEMEEFEDLEFILDLSEYPDEHKIGYARSIIQNGLITDTLKREDKRYKAIRECQVESVEPVEGESSIDPEIQALLTEATELGCVPPNYSTYKSDASRKRRLKEALKASKMAIDKANDRKRKEQDVKMIERGG